MPAEKKQPAKKAATKKQAAPKAISVSLPEEVLAWIDAQGEKRTAIVREAVAALMAIRGIPSNLSEDFSALAKAASRELNSAITKAEQNRWVKTVKDEIDTKINCPHCEDGKRYRWFHRHKH